MDIRQIQNEWQDYQPENSSTISTQEQLIAEIENVERRVKQRSRNGYFVFSIAALGLCGLIFLLTISNVDKSIMVTMSLWLGVFAFNGRHLYQFTQSQVSRSIGVSDYLRAKLTLVHREIHFYLGLWRVFSLPLLLSSLIMSPALYIVSESWTLFIYMSLSLMCVVGHKYCKNLVANRLSPLAKKIEADLSLD